MESLDQETVPKAEPDGSFKPFIASGQEPTGATAGWDPRSSVERTAVWGQLKEIKERRRTTWNRRPWRTARFLRRVFVPCRVLKLPRLEQVQAPAMLYEVKWADTYVERAAKATCADLNQGYLDGQRPTHVPLASSSTIFLRMPSHGCREGGLFTVFTRVLFHFRKAWPTASRPIRRTPRRRNGADVSTVLSSQGAAPHRAQGPCTHRTPAQFEESHIELIAPMSFYRARGGTMVMVDADLEFRRRQVCRCN